MMTLEHAVVEMAYENGAINMHQNEIDVKQKLYNFLEDEDAEFIHAVEQWIGTLTEEQVLTLVAGEESEQLAISAKGPDGVDDLLNDIFNEVL